EGLRMRQPVGLPVGPDGDDARREVGLLRGLEQGTEVRPAPRDEDDDAQHAASLPGRPCASHARPRSMRGTDAAAQPRPSPLALSPAAASPPARGSGPTSLNRPGPSPPADAAASAP